MPWAYLLKFQIPLHALRLRMRAPGRKPAARLWIDGACDLSADNLLLFVSGLQGRLRNRREQRPRVGVKRVFKKLVRGTLLDALP